MDARPTDRILTSQQVSQFERNGFVLLKGLFKDEHLDRLNCAAMKPQWDAINGAGVQHVLSEHGNVIEDLPAT